MYLFYHNKKNNNCQVIWVQTQKPTLIIMTILHIKNSSIKINSSILSFYDQFNNLVKVRYKYGIEQ